MSADRSVTVSIEVAVSPDVAFAVFTDDIDIWWRRGPQYRFVAPWQGVLKFERENGGRRLVHVHDEAAGAAYVVGRVLAWEPGRRLAFEWRLTSFTGDQMTEVEIVFEAIGTGTRVTLEHRGWDTLPSDHRARHGTTGPAFVLMIGKWWAEVLSGAREHAARLAGEAR